MKKTNKKGFTIVELVIVIAVIAVLAAILIPSFSHVVEEADKSSDKTLVKNANTILKAEEAMGNKPETMLEVVDILKANDLPEDSLQARLDGHRFGWDTETNTFMLLCDATQKAVFPANATFSRATTYFVVNNASELELYNTSKGSANYIYISSKYSATDNTLNIKSGGATYDFANSNIKKVVIAANGNYIINGSLDEVAIDALGSTRSLTINGSCKKISEVVDADGNGCPVGTVIINNDKAEDISVACGDPKYSVKNLVLNTPNANVNMTGVYTNVTATVANNSLHLKSGSIDTLNLNKGHVVVENGAIAILNLTNDQGKNNKEVSVTAPVGTIKNIIAEKGTQGLPADSNVLQSASDVVREVNSFEELKTQIEMGNNVKLVADITNFKTAKYSFNSAVIEIESSLTLDLNGHSICFADKTQKANETFMFEVQSDATFTIKDSSVAKTGMIDADICSTAYVVVVNGTNAVVNIENGCYKGSMTAVHVYNGTANISGGAFELSDTCKAKQPADAKYIINCQDGDYLSGNAKINVTGGTFGYDPSANPEGAGTSYVVAGYKSVDNKDGTWSVVKA